MFNALRCIFYCGVYSISITRFGTIALMLIGQIKTYALRGRWDLPQQLLQQIMDK